MNSVWKMNHSLDLVQPCNQVTEQALTVALDNIRMQQTKWTLRDREWCQCASAESVFHKRHSAIISQTLKLSAFPPLICS
ncbi:hypothetical protein CDAR_577321 [Caerostris darwini]|uniref:Uncharacterized protein n=1 Tax=Caerostris darwini TaxID=1538125 RepID=A0AAV4MM63_9ARAC|nr:hypothetical protein CDAR_577321 [Caerostris darwini]